MNTKSTIIAALLVAAIAAIAFVPANGSDAVEIPAEDVQIDYYAEAKWLDISLPSEYADTYKYTITGDDGSSLEDEVAIIDKGDSARGSIEGIVLDTSNVYYTIELTGVTHSDNTAVANFGAVTVTIVQPDNGQIVVMNGENQVNDGDKVAVDTSLDITVTADQGYQVVGETSYTLIVNSDVTIAADIQPVPVTYTIASNNAAWGTVSVEEVTVTAGTEPAFDGATVTIGGTVVTATPADADEQYTYSFVEWNVDGTTITAVFEQTAIVYDVTVAPAENGTVTATPTAGAFGEEVTITMTPSQGYVLGELTINGVTVTDGIDEADGIYTYVTVIAGDITVSATFVEPAGPDREFSNQIILADGAVIDEKSSINASYTQEVLVTGDVKVIAGGEIFINGKLTIQDGASLEIVSGGKVIVDRTGLVDVQGDLVAEAGTDGVTFQYGGCKMTVAGTVILEGADSFATTSTATGIEVSGLFEVGEEATADIDGMTVAKGGELAVYGVASGTVSNAGTVTIDSEGISAESVINDLTISITAVDAVVNVDNVFGTVTVTDADMKFTYQGQEKDMVNDNTVTFTNVSGAAVTESVQYKTENGTRNGYNTMNLSGAVDVASNYDATEVDGAAVAVVSENRSSPDSYVASFAIGEDMSFGEVAVTLNGSISVSAAVDAVDATITLDGDLRVTGSITAGTEIKGDTVSAAMYSTGTGSDLVYVYTTLKSALDAGATAITVTGSIVIAEDITIPVGTTVDVRNAKEVTIEEQATVTVQAADRKSGKLVTSAEEDYIAVDGTLVVQDLSKSGLKEAAVLSDTFNKADDAVTYTNIYNAVASAADGETVEVARGAPLTLEKDLTVPAGVTLSIPESEYVDVDNGVTVTVDGKLVVNGIYTIADETGNVGDADYEAAGATVVNGMMQFVDNDELLTYYSGKIAGAYYLYKDMCTISPLATAAELVNDIESEIIYLFGDIVVGDIAFDYSGEEMVILIVDEDSSLEAGTITLGGIAFAAYGVVTADIAMANGTVSLVNVLNIGMMDVHHYVDDDLVSISVIAGYVEAYDDPDTTAVETGSVTVASGSVSLMEFATGSTVDFTVASGATATVYAGVFTGDVYVDGTMTLASESVSTEEAVELAPGTVRFQTVTVMGTFSAEGSKTATFTTLYVGITAKDLGIGAAASVDGLVPADAYSVAFVSPDSTVGESFEGLGSTEYYVEDALYVTAYANKSNDVAIDGVQVEPENALFQYWYAVVDDKVVVIDYADYPSHTVGAFDKVFAEINYKIYSIKVIAGNGVGTVAVNGVVMEKDGNNTFTMSGLVAGTYTITYTVKTGYEGTSTMTVDGKVIDGKVTLSGTDVRSVTVNLSDVEPNYTAPVADDDGMGLTDYLLIVLVVLILVMAVIVAMRLMRS